MEVSVMQHTRNLSISFYKFVRINSKSSSWQEISFVKNNREKKNLQKSIFDFYKTTLEFEK